MRYALIIPCVVFAATAVVSQAPAGEGGFSVLRAPAVEVVSLAREHQYSAASDCNGLPIYGD